MKAYGLGPVARSLVIGLVLLGEATLLLAQDCAPVPSGLIGLWRGEGNGNDETGAHNGTTPFGMSYVAGEVGQAFSYHFANYDMSRVTVPDSPDFKLTNSLTIEAWIYPKATCNYVLFRGDDRPGLDPYSVDCRTLNAVGFTIDDLNGNSARVEAPIQYNQWQHIAATLDGTTGDMRLYVNGVLGGQIHTAVRPGAELDPNHNPGLGIGNVEGTFQTWPFNGMIDEVALYSRALLPSEIQAIFNAGSAGKCNYAGVPVITYPPNSQTVSIGATVNFTVSATGTPPLSYQWQLDGTNLLGQTGTSLVLSNAQVADSGRYSVVVSDAAGATTSADAVLTVQALSNCARPPAGLVAWWRGEGNTLDSVGTNNGNLGGNATYAPGQVGYQAFAFDGTNSYVSIPSSSSLDVGTGQGLTIEGWLKPQGDIGSDWACLAEWNDGAGNLGAHFWLSQPAPYPYLGGGPGCLFVNLVDTGFNFHLLSSPAYTMDTNGWQHVAVTYDKASGEGVIYRNGVVVASANLGSFQPQTSYGFNLGKRLSFGDIYGPYRGAMDEMSLYGRALSTAEIQAIYAAGGAGKCSSNPPPACVAPPSGLVAWWRAEGNAHDSVGKHNGIMPFGMLYSPGEVGQAFTFNHSQARVSVSDSPEFWLTNTLTIEGWIYPKTACNYVFCRGDDRFGWDPYFVDCRTPNKIAFGITGRNGMKARVEAPIQYRQWQHFAAVLDGASGQMRLYVNGVLGGQLATTLRPLAGLMSAYHPAVGIGNVGGTVHSSCFNGMVDELALYSRALSEAEINALYSAGTAGKCQARPYIVAQPASQTVWPGLPATLTVAAGGTPHLSYQWLHNGKNIPGATAETLKLAQVKPANFGSYCVRITNAFGSMFSSNAVLTAASAPTTRLAKDIHSPSLTYQQGGMHLSFRGTAGVAYQVEASTNLLDWETVGTATELGNGAFEFTDPQAASFQTRFYRLIAP